MQTYHSTLAAKFNLLINLQAERGQGPLPDREVTADLEVTPDHEVTPLLTARLLSFMYSRLLLNATLLGLRCSLLTLPAHAIFGVFENNPAVSKFVSQRVRASKVSSSSRFLALVYCQLNLAVEHI